MNFIILLSGLIFHFSNTPKHFIFPISDSKPSSLNIPNSNKFIDYKKYGKIHINNANAELTNIQETYTKLKLLKYLENSDISVPDKIEAIKEHNFIHKKSPLSTDITAGGLMDDWNFELEQ